MKGKWGHTIANLIKDYFRIAPLYVMNFSKSHLYLRLFNVFV